MSKVNVALGFTMNLGNFESLRLDFGFEDSVLEGETPEDAFARVYEEVEQQLVAKQKEARKTFK